MSTSLKVSSLQHPKEANLLKTTFLQQTIEVAELTQMSQASRHFVSMFMKEVVNPFIYCAFLRMQWPKSITVKTCY